jgi:hypothetical protein
MWKLYWEKMNNTIRDLNSKCIYCNSDIEVECKQNCFLEIFTETVLNSPPFRPSKSLTNKISSLFTDELLQYMFMVTKALEDITTVGRLKALSKDYSELHNFATALDELDHFSNTTEVVNFYKNPSEWEEYSRVWGETGKPLNEKSEGWQIFKDYVRSKSGQQT